MATKKHASVSQPEKPVKEPKKTQKVDFRQMIGKNKQLRNQFSKTNEEELTLQMQIVTLHKNKKDFLEYIRNKFDLNYSNKHKYLKKKKKTEDIYHFNIKEPEHQSEKLSPFEARM